MATFEFENLKEAHPSMIPLPDQRPVIFLDIDDVLCVHRTLNTTQVLLALAGDETVNAVEVWQQIFYSHAVENLRLLNEEFRPWFVISSSWTLHLTREQLFATFEATGMAFVAGNLHEHWCTPRDDDSYRLVEIDAWLDAYAWKGSRQMAPAPYVIIDDVLSGQSLVGSHLEQCTVFCNASAGFLFPQLKAARRVLSAGLGRK
ncbi:hypothetical protein HH213_17260 [Duganella dendranthematis]|uniref:Uncharacterized protein n=1 Tax=Duganella dendranthematis TaxID=2728021 RepID=A0ABX6MC27_9BURK|nr:HAD domain-containing protein [Duganella dendranthematis]QJD91681.1 hypothetical protein HH213_17260 [Duganella dendranthematis]